jgi:hypothetical protein
MESFADWLRRTGRSESTVLKYVGAVNGVLSEWSIAAGLSRQGLQTICDPIIFGSISSALSRLPTFQERNATGNHMYSSALSRYSEFIQENHDDSGSGFHQSPEIGLDELKRHWLEQVSALELRYRLSDCRSDLKSPTFIFGNWRIGIEHQRKYESVVISWIGPETFKPEVHQTWTACPISDQSKGWNYRKRLLFPDIEGLLVELSKSDLTEEECRASFDHDLRRSKGMSSDELQRRLDAADKMPRSYEVRSRVFVRNTDVVVAVLIRANGICEECGSPAPFSRRSDNSPFLEVHHRRPLADGGEDSVQNAIALCPNCHRKAHYG